MRHLLWLFLLPLLATGGMAQIPGPPNLVTASPYPYVPLSPGQHNLAVASATALTVPALATYAAVCASTATVRYTTDGTTTPTSTVGMPLSAGTCIGLSGPLVLANFQAFSTSGTLDVEYFK